MSEEKSAYQVLPFPKVRRLMVDGGRIGRGKHTVHGLLEVDVTEARKALHAHKNATGETLSFTAFVTHCLGQAVDANKYMHACRDWRGRLVIFEEVDVNTLFEVEVNGRRVIRPHVLRAANKKSVRELHDEIRAYQSDHETSRESRLVDSFVLLPGWIRRTILGALLKNPHLSKEYQGTVLMSGLGMFGEGAFWGIPVPNHTLQITLGGIGGKPAIVDGEIAVREFMSVTMSFDHDIVDGVPAAKFGQRFKNLVEASHGLESLT